ncbi:MAG: integrase [Citrobacter freundii]|uniref:tyrosine-type recombinase/integrase n=1 Tax=Citrobacter TaxID=544 RepID=UPI000778C25E|nr:MULTISPECIES: tyrosine-type recombinase/integrase [Citrobacter]EJR7282041.1 tyrosine-type recombinase/integrase [Citrobacter freundii]EKT9243298.1 tyrosine-type recombinase/integrase [Citrobacter freundii]EKW8509729.1 tyrosine-type recombinase/integrase [Citrobacter freundii]EMB4318349.1 tyrosine-type recombinase/integrase [Citrobacter freundii]KYC28003.1 integrase [Citrobacter sp. AATXQ]
MTIKGKGTNYLYVNCDGIYIIQLHIPVYMRHLWNGRKMLKKSTGTRDLVLARRFRDQYLMEFRRLQAQFNPNAYLLKIQSAITDLRFVGAASTNLVPDFQTATKGKPSTPKLKDLCDEYMKVYSDRRSYSTLQKSARAVDAFTKSIKRPAITIGGIGRRMVTEFLEANQGKFSPQTLQNWLTSLGSLYEFAKRRYDAIPDSNPFHGHNLEARRTIESYQPFEPDQMQKLLDAAEPEIRNIITMGLFSGCRLDELASLKKLDIQTVEGVRCFYISKSKTKAGIRHVPIHSRLSAIVDEYLNHTYGEYLFPQANRINRKDGKKGPFYSQAFTRLRHRVLPTATDRQCFHSLRGMFITCLDRAGVPEQRIGAITGHTDQKSKTEAFRTYSQGASMEELAGYVGLVSYDIVVKR